MPDPLHTPPPPGDVRLGPWVIGILVVSMIVGTLAWIAVSAVIALALLSAVGFYLGM